VRRRLTYSNVVSTLALFLVLGGGFAFAAALKKNSVKSKQIANGAVKTSELGPDAATGDKVSEGTLGKVPAAVTADTAASAGVVGGRSADALRSIAAFAEDTTPLDLTISPAAVVTTQITTHSPSLITASFSAELEGGTGDGNTAACRIELGSSNSALYSATSDDLGSSNPFSMAIDFAHELPAGTYAVSVTCSKGLGADVTKNDADITVIAVPD
jgi:hypothetical protein